LRFVGCSIALSACVFQRPHQYFSAHAFVGIVETQNLSPEEGSMRKYPALTIIVLSLVSLALAANKESGSTTLTNVQPAGTKDKKH